MAETKPQITDQQRLRQQMARALTKGGMDDVHVVSHDTADAVLTDRRREIINTLKESSPESVRALARQLGRDKAAVSRDLRELAEHNIITYEEDGRAKRPILTQDHVVIEPIV
ncbi:HTH domain protein (plasmid) [Halobacterium hubeiense]|jgi:predicted transcriptional regulator|uniref:HTH domain protein n=1 Tax=Halobacterium hubeiense TaxID=1407499 RepID=A0A0U5H866_9EURY|nr:ArsR family transcriptional regulator [Halobacterium hubeiense]CQH65220.1 HTH domain protein [Halobacterium hubeiense]